MKENTGARGGDSAGRKSEGSRKDLQQRQHSICLGGGEEGAGGREREVGAGGGEEGGGSWGQRGQVWVTVSQTDSSSGIKDKQGRKDGSRSWWGVALA